MITTKEAKTLKDYYDIISSNNSNNPVLVDGKSKLDLEETYGTDAIKVVDWMHLLFKNMMGGDMNNINYMAAKELKKALAAYIKNREVK